ncbi:MAG TPA: hypothetical protein VGM98_16185 [Schlesneria sp.]
MRLSFCAILVIVAAVFSRAIADDRTQSVAPDDDREFTATVRILEANRKNLLALGFDSSKEESEQLSPLSPREFRSRLKELQKLGQTKVLAEPALNIALNKMTKSFSGGEIPVPTVGSDGKPGQRWVEFGTRVEIRPTLQPDGSLSLQWYVSNATYRYSKATRLFGKKVPIVSGWQSQGDLVVPDDRVVLLIPEGGLNQEDVLVLQFDVEESRKTSSPLKPAEQ